jgi:hypothetical protein
MKLILCLALASWIAGSRTGAAPDANLNFNFDAAVLGDVESKLLDWPNPFLPEPLRMGTGLTASLLPGWTVTVGGVPQARMALDNGFFEAADPLTMPAHAALLQQTPHWHALQLLTPWDGPHALLLDNTRRRELSDPAVVQIRQNVEIPADAQALSWRVLTPSGPGLVLGENVFPPSIFQLDATDAARVRFSIAPWAGQVLPLGFTTLGDQAVAIDSIVWIVPEPSPGTLLAAGAAVVWLLRRTQRRLSARKNSG